MTVAADLKNLKIAPLVPEDIAAAAAVHALAFPRQRNSDAWLAAKVRAYPATYSYTAKLDGKLAGGILWTHKSGFRERAVLELEQIFVAPELQRHGIGRRLILGSLHEVNEQIQKQGFEISTLCVNTRSDNNAAQLYKKTLGVEKVFELAGHTPGATEVFLAATDVQIESILARQ